MTPSIENYKKLLGRDECARTPGGRCVGNCRAPMDEVCARTPGGRCVGNCRAPMDEACNNRCRLGRPVIRLAS